MNGWTDCLSDMVLLEQLIANKNVELEVVLHYNFIVASNPPTPPHQLFYYSSIANLPVSI